MQTNEIKIKKFLSENDELINSLSLREKTLLNAPMKAGKSEFTLTQLKDKAEQEGLILVFIVPQKTLMTSIVERCKEKNIKYQKICGDEGYKSAYYVQDSIYIVTTDSSYKVLAMLKEQGKQAIYVYDEKHKAIMDCNFRPKLFAPMKEYTNNKDIIVGFIGLTATSEPIKYLDWDNIIKVEVEEKFVPTKEINVIKYSEIDESIIYHHAKELAEKGSVFGRINNKSINENIKLKLEYGSKLKATTFCRENYNTEEEAEEQERKILELFNSTSTNSNVILSTSLFDCGVEINAKDLHVLVVRDNKTRAEDLIQFIGRFRNEATSVTILDSSKPLDDEISDLRTCLRTKRENIRNRQYNYYNNVLKCMKSQIKDRAENVERTIKHDKGFLLLGDDDNLEIELNIPYIEYLAYMEYQQIIPTELLLKDSDIFDNKINIIEGNIEKAKASESDILELTQAIKDKKAEGKKVIKAKKESLQEFINKADNLHTLEVFTDHKDISEVLKEDKWIIRSNEEHHYDWHSLEFTEYRGNFHYLEKRLKAEKKEITLDIFKKIMLLALNKSKMQELEKQKKYIEANKGINSILEIDKKIVISKIPNERIEQRALQRVARIRKTVIELFGKERDISLGKINLNKLLEPLQKQRVYKMIDGKNKENKLSKTSDLDKALDNLLSDLKLIYNLKANNNTDNIISSAKLDLDINKFL